MRRSILTGAAAVVGAAIIGRNWRTYYTRRNRQAEHVSQTEEAYRKASTRILVLGAGFGGLATALKLDQQLRHASDVSILVVDRNNDLLFTPLLWTTASGRTSPNNVVVPIRNFQKGRRFHVLHAEVEQIDLERKEVQTSAGMRPYDILVMALGSHTAVPNLPGLRTFALEFHTPSDALQLRNHLIDAIEAAHRAESLQERKEWLTFVVGGAGDTGVELAAVIHDYLLSGLFSEYPWLADESFRIVVIGRPDRVVPTSKPSTSQMVQRVLEGEGIEVLTGRAITGVTETTVETDKGSIPARTFFWAAGIAAPDVIRQLPVKHAHNGAVIVDDHLRIPEHPEVYAIGDSAWAYDAVTGSPVPATAQAARQQGSYIGKAIAAEYRKTGAVPYRYNPLGHLALLGHNTGVAELGPVTFTGRVAWLLWHLAYLVRVPSWSKRIRLVVDWFLSWLLGREIGQLRLQDPEQVQSSKLPQSGNETRVK